MSHRAKLTELGLELPPVVAPLASYVPAVRSGNLVFTSGQLPMVDGKLVALDTPRGLKNQYEAQDMDEVFRKIARGGG